MIAFQDYLFLDTEANKVDKWLLFQHIYDNHTFISPDKEFIVDEDINCQLLMADNHPSIRRIKRQYEEFVENQAMLEATATVLNKKAIAIVRDNITTDTITPQQAIDLAFKALEQAFINYEDIENEIESLISKT